mmetsp:Transcript_36775/g.80312  ORF Transcript_36775/g.80312 Transcript_36775/m.80312 type:complete len:244 (-) Transcript_36775:370-1101(-)
MSVGRHVHALPMLRILHKLAAVDHPSIWRRVLALTVHHAAQKRPLVGVAICVPQHALALEDAPAELPLVDRAVGELASTLSVEQVVLELSFEGASVGTNVPADTVMQTVDELAAVRLTRSTPHLALALHGVAVEVTLVHVAICKADTSTAAAHIFPPGPLIDVTARTMLVEALAIALAVRPLPIIHVAVGVPHDSCAVVPAATHLSTENGIVREEQGARLLVEDQGAAAFCGPRFKQGPLLIL